MSSAQPQYESISVPRNECSSQVVNEAQPVGGQRQYGGAVIGGVAGALLGNQVGREVTSCRTVNEVQTRISGYRVDHEYRGQYYTAMLHENPGPRLQLRVSIDPVGR